jgi:uncharacterized protein YkwD
MDVSAAAMDPPVLWAEVTSSPVALSDPPPDALEREALAHCGVGEAGLREASRRAVSRVLRGLPLTDPDTLAFEQRSAGEPHPWARAWAASAKTLSTEATLRRLDEWLAEDREPRLRRCAVASAVAADGTHALAVVAVEALADLAPVPTRARTGQWLEVRARLHVAAAGGSVLVLGPSGAPRRVPAWLDGTVLHARFALDRPGAFTVQVLASTASGPRPVAEASVFADVEPPAHAGSDAAPGEEASEPARGDEDDLANMLAIARETSGEPPLTRDARLDAMGRVHASQMAAAHLLGHDAGDGEPTTRAEASGLSFRALGENVAHAGTVALAHRALWASPSHRANMLRRDFDRVGVAVVRDGRGDAWVVETFTSELR